MMHKLSWFLIHINNLFSSSEEEEDEEPEQTEEEEEEADLIFKSDHEFSPESDLEEGAEESLPMRRARTAKKGENIKVFVLDIQ